MATFWERLLWGPAGRKSLDGTLAYWKDVYGSRESKSGQSVTTASALEVTTVLGCVRAIAEGVAQSRIRFRTSGDDRPRIIRQHPVLDLLTWKPNEWQTAFEFIETVMIHLAMTNNAFVFKNMVGAARSVSELIPLQPGDVTVEQLPDMRLRYMLRDKAGTTREIPAEAMWHLRGPSWNGWFGMDAVKLAREAIGLAMATESKHARMHKNSADPGGVYSVPEKLNPEQFKTLRDWIVRTTSGDLAGSPLILDRGTEWVSQQMKGVDAQHLETRRFQVEEICRAFRVIPMMVGYSDKTATYASAEQMFIAHVVHTITPWATRFEQSAERNLLAPGDEVDIRFDLKSLMRGDQAARAEYFTKALGSGGAPAWMTQAEVREEDGLEWMDGTDRLPEPTNVGGAPTEGEPAPAAADPDDSGAKALAVLEDKAAERHADMIAAIRAMPAPEVNVTTPAVTVNAAPISVTVPVTPAKRGTVTKKVTAFDEEGRIAEMTETESED